MHALGAESECPSMHALGAGARSGFERKKGPAIDCVQAHMRACVRVYMPAGSYTRCMRQAG